ncbi:MAG TPA: YetF domain-containing protein [Brevundimonas sp.]|nr:YetF domain-containing protein [Brevundimonas sp.]
MDWTGMLFQGWPGLARTVIVGALAYVGLVLILRLSGKRTLSKLNAFDLVVTVALGSTLATILMDEKVALAEGLIAYATLIGLQWLVAWTSTRSRGFARAVRAEPSVLLRDGAPLEAAMRRERVTEGELLGAVREAGGRDLSAAEVVLLEGDGALTAILKR